MSQGTNTQRSMSRTYMPRIAFFLLTLLTMLGQTMPVAQASGKASSTSGAALNALQAKAQQQGTVRLIVGLNVAHAPESALGSPAAVADQRQGIARAQQGLLQRMANRKIRATVQFEYIPFIAVEADAAAVQALNMDPNVTTIEEDSLSEPTLEQSIPLIGGSATGTFGSTNRTGAGQTVAVLDTGVMKTHSFLANKVVSEACFSTTNAAEGSTAVCAATTTVPGAPGSGVNCPDSVEGCDHGTHVAGIVAGKGANFNGVAKDATIIAIQVFSRFEGANCRNGSPCVLSYDSDQISALEHVYKLRTSHKISAVNMSLGGGGPHNTNCDTAEAATKKAIDNLLAAGIATIIASGNASFNNGVGSPSCISTAVTVGSTTKSDTVSSFSNSGEPIDLLAPGSDILSSVSSSTTAFASYNGTSMATPHVAGAWAVLKQQNPNASVAQIQQTLQNTGVAVTDTDNGVTRKRISLTAAVNALPTGPNPVPTITSIAPTTVGNGSMAFTLTVNGTNFVQGAMVRWNGSNRTTTFVSPTRLTAAITAGDVAVSKTVPVTVFNPAPGGGPSIAKNFVVASSCSNFEPNDSAAAAKTIAAAQTQTHVFCTSGDQDWLKFSGFVGNKYTIDTLNFGSGVNTVISLFDATGKVLVAETADAATPVTSLVSFTPQTNGTYFVKLRNRTTGFGPTATYNVRMTSMVVPRITSLSPATKEAGVGDFVLSVRGSGFVAGSTIRWKGVNRATTFVSASELRATITRADISTAGTIPVTVMSATPGAGLSNDVNFTVTPAQTAPKPTVTGLSTTTIEAGSTGFVLAVKGTNFVPRSVVRWAGVVRPTTFVSASDLRITLSDADLATAGTKAITVNTSAPGGGLSNSVNFTITPQVTPCQRDEPNDTLQQAKVFPFNTPRDYGFCTDDDIDVMKFSAAANSAYDVVIAPGTSVLATATVYDQTGTEIGSVSAACFGCGMTVTLTTAANEGGTYYFEFTNWFGLSGDDAAHRYGITLSKAAGLQSTDGTLDGGSAEGETARVTSQPSGTK